MPVCLTLCYVKCNGMGNVTNGTRLYFRLALQRVITLHYLSLRWNISSRGSLCLRSRCYLHSFRRC